MEKANLVSNEKLGKIVFFIYLNDLFKIKGMICEYHKLFLSDMKLRKGIFKMSINNKLKKESYRSKINTQLYQAQADLERVKEKAYEVGTEKSSELKEYMNVLKQKAELIQTKLNDFDKITDEAWDKFTKDTDENIENLSTKSKAIWTNFKDHF